MVVNNLNEKEDEEVELFVDVLMLQADVLLLLQVFYPKRRYPCMFG